MSKRGALLVLALASLLNILPLILFPIGGDILFQLTMIDCFGRQFWQGDLFPQWCFSADAGLGLPLFLFYFPLPFYVTSLFYPLTAWGASGYQLFVIGSALATFITALTAYSWLKDIVTPGRALLATAILLFAPYRMEVMVFRTAYAEMWALALLPLLFKYARRIARREKVHWEYALSFAGLALTHVPLAAIGGLFSGLYLIIMSGDKWKHGLLLAAMAAIGFSLAAFHLLPGMFLIRFTGGYAASDIDWANTFLGGENLLRQPRLVLALGLSIAALVAFSIWSLVRRDAIADGFARREPAAWAAMLVLAIFLLCPTSRPLYDMALPFSKIIFPWRMQAIMALCFGFFAAVYAQWLIPEKKQKTWRGDFTVLVAAMMLLGFFISSPRPEEHRALFEKMRQAYYVPYPEYHTLWMEESAAVPSAILRRAEQPPPRLRVTGGKGKATVEQWDWSGIVLHTESPAGMRLQLDHRYFPTWRARDENGNMLALAPQERMGLMILDVPAGSRRIIVTQKSFISSANAGAAR